MATEPMGRPSLMIPASSARMVQAVAPAAGPVASPVAGCAQENTALQVIFFLTMDKRKKPVMQRRRKNNSIQVGQLTTDIFQWRNSLRSVSSRTRQYPARQDARKLLVMFVAG